MLEILHELYLSKEIACIYSNYDDTSEFNVGKILAINEDKIAIQLISPNGENDGIVVMDTDCIYLVETNSRYIEKIKKLCGEEAFFICNIQVENDNIISSILSYAFKENQVVSIELNDSGYKDVVGIIKAITDTECKIEQIDVYGYVDGERNFLIENVTHVNAFRDDEKRIMRLYEINRTNNK